MTTGDRSRRGPGRPRSPEAEGKILQAALEEYAERGWSGFTMEGVARRSGIGKSSLYLRWSDKDALLTDAIRRRTHRDGDVDTGSLHGDLVGLTTAMFQEFAGPTGWAAFRMVLEAASTSQARGGFTDEVSGWHRGVVEGVVETVVQRARERGELADGVEAQAMTDLLYGAALFFVLGRRLEERAVTEEALAARAEEVASVLTAGLVDTGR